MKSMTKETVAVTTDASDRKFVYEVEDEADKNHDAHDNSVGTIGEGTLAEVPGHPLFLVKTFQDYIIKLHPDENHYGKGLEKRFGVFKIMVLRCSCWRKGSGQNYGNFICQVQFV